MKPVTLAPAGGSANNMGMIASAAQTFAVVLIVAAAAGYLSLCLRKSLKGKGGCCCGLRRRCSPSSGPGEDGQDERSGGRPFVPRDNLVDQARRHAASRSTSRAEEPE